MADHLERIGQIVGDYRLQRWLGGGGFGNVYLAEPVRGDQQVAVKVLQIRLTRPDDLRAFINEARTIRLRHPHIVPLLDFGLSRENTPFLIMEYAPNGTLRDRHPKDTHVPLPTAVEYATQIASALQYAHEHHLVHRDVKPENMLVRSDGAVLLSDFGIATAAQSTYSTKQEMVGTIPYMAPEQLAGKPRAASDQYALAVVIYEWLAGRTPFQGTAIEVAMQHATQPPPSLVALAPEVPLEVEAALFKALAKDHRERFASVQEFVSALPYASAPPTFRRPAFPAGSTPLREASPPFVSPIAPLPAEEDHAFIDPFSMVQAQATPMTKVTPGIAPSREVRTISGDPFQNIPPMTPTKGRVAPRVRKRHLSKGLVALSLVLVVLLIAGGSYTYSTVRNMQATETVVARRDATATVRAASTAAVRATATAVVKAADDAYNGYVAQHGIMFGFDAAHTRNNPYEHILNAVNVSQLHQAWATPTGNSIDSSPTIANGMVYIDSKDGKLYAFDALTGQQKWTVPMNSDALSSPAAANGVVYVGSRDGTLYAFDALTGQQKWTAPMGSFIDSSPTIANSVVYVGSGSGKLYAFDTATGQQKWMVSAGDSIFSSPAVANGMIYVGSGNGGLYAFDAATGQQKPLTMSLGLIGAFSSPAVANGMVYAGSGTNADPGDNGLHAFDAVTGQQKWIAPTSSGIDSSPAVANGVVYVGSNNGILYAFDAMTGQQKWTDLTGGRIFSSPAVANGIVYVGTYDSKLYAFDAATGQQKWTASTQNVIESSPAVANGIVYVGSSDSKLYAFSLPKNSA